MSAYEGSKQQEADENRKKYTGAEAVKMAVDAVKSMGIADAHAEELDKAFKRGYWKAIEDMEAKLKKLFPI